jgi:Glycosyltransferases involved in cell wall biogenesis
MKMNSRVKGNRAKDNIRAVRKSENRRVRKGKISKVKDLYDTGLRSVGWFWPKTAHCEPPEEIQWTRHLNASWAKWFKEQGFKNITDINYPHSCRQFIRGFCEAVNINITCDLLLPTAKSVACIITAMNESETLKAQLGELTRLPFEEIIVVLNGSTDNSHEVVRHYPNRITVVYFDAALGYDVGRAVGAKVSNSEILLFLDGDMSIGVDLLLPFIYEMEKGADVVLNPISSLLPKSGRIDSVSVAKQFLNVCLGRKDLLSDSLTAIPHALSRNAVKKIGYGVLAVPPVAHARAVRLGLSILKSPETVDVITSNRIRRGNTGLGNRVERLILGDHLEALHELMKDSGPRLWFKDNVRQRDFENKGEAKNDQYERDHPDL